ncbi:MAG: hypothetical protein M1821_000396 [Bathelium mastoideum]|nr:MAG: hypothetical protein M1821_000396 [Bathelium mastoideum]
MASTAAWLDDLSEDWEPQPRDSSPLSNTHRTNSLRRSVGDGRASQSKIPRPLTGSKKDKHSLPRRSSILSERSMSENNILKDSPNHNSKPRSSRLQLSRSHSTSSLQSDAQFDTVDRKSLVRSPPKQSSAQLTPEWKRRLLKNNGDSAEQTDLFSPVGLERIFKNPKNETSPSKSASKRGISFLKDFESIPSSPPIPFTYSDPDQSYLDRHHPPSELEPVEEADEDEGDHQINDSVDSPLQKASEQDESSFRHSPQHNSSLDASFPTQPEHAITSEQINIQQDGSQRDESLDSTQDRGNSAERTLSGQSELRHEGFSPIVLSKETTSKDFPVSSPPGANHAPLDFQMSQDMSTNKQVAPKNPGGVAEGSSRLGDSLPDDLETGTPELAEIGGFVGLKRGSFYETASFRKRPLSISFNRDISDLSNKFSPISVEFSSPSSNVLPPGSHQPARFRRASSSQLSRHSHHSKVDNSSESLPSELARTPIVLPKRRKQSQYAGDDGSDSSSVQPEVERVKTVDGKRPRSSPDKERTTKRQKTMHGIEFSELSKSTLNAVQARHEGRQSIIGKKRKDARHESSALQVDPLAISHRHILRPRNPTPSQRRGTQADVNAQGNDSLDLPTAATVHHVQEQLESLVLGASSPPPRNGPPLPEPVATLTMNAAKRMQNEGRKRSYTTQDYLDEAMQIMSRLRAGRRPESGLGSVQESVSEHGSDEAPDHDTVLTNLTVSRPPSREGAISGWRRPVQECIDTEVAIHLRQYREGDNTEFTIDSSLRSLRLKADRGQDKEVKNNTSKEYSDLVSIKSHPRNRTDARKEESENVDDESEFYSSTKIRIHPAPQSWDSSTGKTIATSSTRRSDTVANLAPDAVAHLIPEQIAGMSFDAEKHVWVKDKSLPKFVRGIGGLSGIEESEQDPLGDIPDLSVDEFKELSRNVSQAGGTVDMLKRFAEDPSLVAQVVSSSGAPRDYRDGASASQETVIARPQTREGHEESRESSSVPSRDPQLASSTAPIIETRATSWSTTQAAQDIKERAIDAVPGSDIPNTDEDVEHEIQATHGRVSGQTNGKIHRVIVSFSSPAIPRMSLSHNIDVYPKKSDEYEGLGQKEDEGAVPRRRKQRSNESLFPSSTVATPTVKSHKKQANLFSHIPEHEEWSLLPIVDNPRELSFQVNVSSPQADDVGPINNNALISPSGQHRTDLTFYLSELPEFSYHQIDERKPSEQALAQRLASHELAQTHSAFAETIKVLVRELTNVEPEEPFWDELQHLDLHNRQLTSLHGLNEFCPQVQDLDVSANGLNDLSGAPMSVRCLRAQNNALSSLTAFGFLMNLQYLDISGNRFESLDGLSCLIHLRELVANDNEISELGELKSLDGLQQLALKRNRIEKLDFSNSHLDHLVELDLSGNHISSVSGLDLLPQLSVLDLDDNKLCTKSFEFDHASTCRSLSVLKLRRNVLQQLPLALFPSVRTLLADENQLPVHVDVSQLEHLETFSLRGQQAGTFCKVQNELFKIPNSDVRQLDLSANRIPAFTFRRPMYDLQRLDLASSGLHTLPSDLAILAPNLRYVNLNFNAVKDIRPLLGLHRLRELHLVGNRLSRVRKAVVVLAKLKALVRVDIRDNPCTVGFYPQGKTVTSELVLRGSRGALDEDVNVLPRQSAEEDTKFRSRLDEETHLRRKVYELLIAGSCKSIRTVDGLDIDRHDTLVKDPAWKLLINGGVVRKPELLSS